MSERISDECFAVVERDKTWPYSNWNAADWMIAERAKVRELEAKVAELETEANRLWSLLGINETKRRGIEATLARVEAEVEGVPDYNRIFVHHIRAALKEPGHGSNQPTLC